MTIYDHFPDIIQNPIFRDVSPQSVNPFFTEDTLRKKNFSAHEPIYSSESEALSVGILCSGGARVLVGNGEESTILNTLAPGDMFGIANLFDEGSPFPTRIVATSGAEVLFLDGEAFRRCILEEPQILRNYLAHLSRKLMYLNRKIITFTAGSAERKLLLFLLEQHTNGRVCLPCSMSELAERLGIGRASLYRARDALIREGLLACAEGGFFIPDFIALKNRYESS